MFDATLSFLKNNGEFKTLLERNGISNQNVSVNYVANNTNKYIDHSLMISLPQPQSSMVPFDYIKQSLIDIVKNFYIKEFEIDYTGLVVSATNYGSINIQVSILNPKYKINPAPSFFAERSVEIKTLNIESTTGPISDTPTEPKQTNMVLGNKRTLANKKAIPMKYSWNTTKYQ
jgi:hypothetical protein